MEAKSVAKVSIIFIFLAAVAAAGVLVSISAVKSAKTQAAETTTETSKPTAKDKEGKSENKPQAQTTKPENKPVESTPVEAKPPVTVAADDAPGQRKPERKPAAATDTGSGTGELDKLDAALNKMLAK